MVEIWRLTIIIAREELWLLLTWMPLDSQCPGVTCSKSYLQKLMTYRILPDIQSDLPSGGAQKMDQ